MPRLEPKAPAQFAKTLELFAKAISNPTSEEPSSELLKEIQPTTIRSASRSVKIYQEQYWRRLHRLLQQDFPILVRVLGRKKFNELIATPYLSRFPSDTWTLYPLGASLPAWMEGVNLDNHTFLKEAMLIDLGYNEAFISGELPPLNPQEIDEATPLTLQSHLSLHSCHSHLPRFRKALLKESPEYYEEHPLPPQEEGNFYFVLYRKPQLTIAWKEIEKEEYLLLSAFRSGATIEEACSLFENEADLLEETVFELFQQWMQRGWLTVHKP